MEELLLTYCKNGNLEKVKELSTHVDIHANKEILFRTCVKSGHVELVKWFFENNTEVHHNNDEAFTDACLNGYVDIVILFTQYSSKIRKYLADIDNNQKIIKFKIENLVEKYTDDKKFEELCKYLGIQKAMCLICHGVVNIQLPCNHFYCIQCLLEWNREHEQQCTYCQQPYTYDKCEGIL